MPHSNSRPQPITVRLHQVEEELVYLNNADPSPAKFNQWLASSITQQLFLTIERDYLTALTDETTVMAYLEKCGEDQTLPHNDPVSETAINSAIRSGKVAVLSDLIEWQPRNLEEVE